MSLGNYIFQLLVLKFNNHQGQKQTYSKPDMSKLGLFNVEREIYMKRRISSSGVDQPKCVE